MYITYEIHEAFNCNPSLEDWGVFLDIIKAFRKVSQDELLYKLTRNDINDDLLKLVEKVLPFSGELYYMGTPPSKIKLRLRFLKGLC